MRRTESRGRLRQSASGVLAPLAVCFVQLPPAVLFSRDAFPDHIADAEPLLVNVSDFAQLPDFDGKPPRIQNLVDVPGADRLIASTAAGLLYAVSYDGTEASPYLDIGHDQGGVMLLVEPAPARGVGLDGVAFHPHFAADGTPGFGKFYTLQEVSDTEPPADFTPGHGSGDLWDTVLLEWTARDPTAWTYDGGPPRELLRVEQPYAGRNGGAISFRSGAGPSAPDYGLLYLGLGDGGGVRGLGDPMGLAQDLGKVYGKLLRIDPLGSNSANGRYGVPADNPFAGDGREDTLGEIWAYGMRNPNSFGWDASNGKLYVADMGAATAEEINLVSAGDNLGWSVWEGSYRVVRRHRHGALARRFARAWSWATRSATGVATAGTPSPSPSNRDGSVTYPVVGYDRHDPLFSKSGQLIAVTGVVVCRDCNVPQLNGKVLFGDLPSGELMYFPADGALASDGPESIRQVLLVEGAGGDGAEGAGKTLLTLVQERRAAQGRDRTGGRVDLRFGTSASGDVFLLNKRDGVIRRLEGPPAGRGTKACPLPPSAAAERELPVSTRSG